MISLFLAGLKKFENDPKLVRRIEILIYEWNRAYPNVNIKEQLQWAHAWLVSSGKPYKDMSKFLNFWMRGAQRRALESKPVALHKPYKEAIPKQEDLLTYEDILESKRKTS